jgi:hypothetical protein
MKLKRIIGIGVVALATAGTSLQAEVIPDKFAPLRTALAREKQETIVGAEDAQFWAEEYEKILADPETDTQERLALRKTLIQEQARAKRLRRQAAQIQATIQSLRRIPDQDAFTLTQLNDAYQGLGDLGARGRAAWDQLLANRDALVETIKMEFEAALAESTALYEDLETAERANQLLLDAIDTNRLEATDAEFHVALKLPSIKSAVKLGFGISGKTQDRKVQAQTTLVALIGYSQYFWDHYAGVRDELGEKGVPSDRTRNIFGVADGGVLTSDAIAENQSNFYFLSDGAKENFNRKIQAIWGSEGNIAVSRWDQNRAPRFARACRGLATPTEQALVPNQQVFELLAGIDTLIEERKEAAWAIQEVRAKYEILLAEAKNFGDKVALSSAHYNAEIWARNSKQSIARFEAAHQLIETELAGSANEDWTPNAKGIAASAQVLSKTHNRFHSVLEVKKELAVLLQ